MVYEVPKSKASETESRFEFKLPSGQKVYSIPLLRFIKPTIAIEIEPLDWREAMQLIFNEAYPKDDLLSKFDDDSQFVAWLDAYKEASKISVGESGASSAS